MEKRKFGRAGLEVSILGFGCGAVGGLMVRGDAADRERAIGAALDAGITYFDTAVLYGNGASETNLGLALKALKPREAVVGTKVRFRPEDKGRIAQAAAESLEGSLKRLQREAVEVFHLHNPIASDGAGETLTPQQAIEEVAPAFERLRAQGKVRSLGITAVGDTAALHAVVDSGRFDAAQVVYNMLNPTAAISPPPDYPAQDYGRLFERTQALGVGVVGIRVLAGGALSGSAERHAIASPAPAPIGSAADYDGDVARARRLLPLVEEGFADSLTEAATRFAISHPAMGTILVGMATVEQFEASLAAVRKGPLSPAALARLAALQLEFAGEAR